MDEDEEADLDSPVFERKGSQVWTDLLLSSAPTTALDYMAP